MRSLMPAILHCRPNASTRLVLAPRGLSQPLRAWDCAIWSSRRQSRRHNGTVIKKRFTQTQYNRLASTLMTTQPELWGNAIHLHQGFPHGLNRHAREGDALLILFSKGFAHLVTAQSAFVQTLVSKIFSQFTPSCVSVYLAVVDRVPASAQFQQAVRGTTDEQSEDDDTCEGWSMILLNRHAFKSQTTAEGMRQDAAIPHVSFTTTESKNGATSAKLPLSNTLFENGQHNTLLHTVWRQQAVESLPRKLQKLELNSATVMHSLDVNLDMDVDAAEGIITVPHERLTPVRRIHQSLGNVVKTLKPALYESSGVDAEAGTEDLDLLSASAELQDKLMSREGGANGRQIFAAVAPRSVFKLLAILWNERYPKDEAAAKQPLMPTASLLRQDILRYTSMGLKLFKVVGGGGEWGTRASLITLQPDSIFAKSDDAVVFDEMSINLDAFKKHLQSSSVAPEGHYIQFYATGLPLATPEPHMDNIVFKMGCRSGELFGTHSSDTAHHHLVTGFFGGITTQAFGIEARGAASPDKNREREPLETSSIDIPGATLTWRLAAARSDSRIFKIDTDLPLSQRMVRALEQEKSEQDASH